MWCSHDKGTAVTQKAATMVCSIDDKHIVAPCVCTSEAQGKFIGLRARACKEGYIKWGRERGCDGLGVVHNVVVQVARVGVESG